MGSRRSRERADHPALRAPHLKEGNWAVAGSFLGGGGIAWGKNWAWARSGAGLGNRTFWTTTTFPRIVRSLTIGFPRKNRATRARTIHLQYRAPRTPPPLGGGRGRSRTQLPNEEKIPGKTTALPLIPLLQEGAGGGPEPPVQTVSQSPAKRCTSHAPIPPKPSEIPSKKFTIPPRLVNGFSASYCKPARKKFPKKLDKGGWGLYLCRWKTIVSRHSHDEETVQQF